MELETSEEISERVSLHVNEHILFRVTYWEVPGKDRYLTFLNNYCVGAAVAIVLFDTTKQSSLEKAEKLLQSIETCDIPFKFLVGNKVNSIYLNIDRFAYGKKEYFESCNPKRC